ncbi:Glycine--tRNA ligase beta subunit [Brevundimonas subvibrioides]|uniref:glycine--tRNA ligase subunit beta n=1 Tax=Brevundimonas subvibrioides TaxID=74313 RepID=UPI0032D57728
MPQLLLELFSEEIPARMQGGAARDLERMATERLKAAGLTWDALTTWAGPRRLTLVIEGLPAATPDRSEELKGPRANAPEQALEGFLRKTGLTRDQLTERDGVLFAVINEAGRPTTTVIAETVDAIVRAFPWPKSMRWGSGTLRWVRPLKRIVALFDGAVVPFEIDGIASGDVTEGHRFMGSGQPFAVRDFADYRAKLEAQFVLLDAADRRLKILEAARAACHARGLELVDDDGLLDEVAGLAEWPTPILGDMDPQFLALPPEVVRLSMKVHQKYFAVRDPATGTLAPNFIVVANVEASDGGVALAAGNSRVLSARLNDARFFWDEDQKTSLEDRIARLSGVTYHAKLGTLAGKAQSIDKVGSRLAADLGLDVSAAALAGKLSKSDLATSMVGEFPELQGVMGGYYARKEGLSENIAQAIEQQYRPAGPNDFTPTTPFSSVVALAEKFTTIVGFFAIGEKPTGSRDPFALRRAALGVIRILLEQQFRLKLDDVTMYAVQAIASESESGSGYWIWGYDPTQSGPGLSADVVASPQTRIELLELHSDVRGFFADRLKVLLRDQGKRHDLVDAVFALGDDDLVRIVRRVEALDAFLATDDGANLLAGYKRASNILKAEAKKGEVPTGMVATGLLNQPEAETTLAFATDVARTAVDTALETEDFAAAMTALSRLRAPVDAFFTDVMVNSDVPAERDNRLKLLGQVRDVMGRVADFGQVAG